MKTKRLFRALARIRILGTLLLLGAASLGCERFDTLINGDGQFAGSSRGRDSARPGEEAEQRETYPENKVLYYSAVEFDSGYNWQQDSAYGKAAADIVLYRDHKEFKRVHCGDRISYEPDLHHIIGGSIYTEYCRAGRTYIYKDGAPLLELDEALRLFGLVEREGIVFTLACPLSGKGLVFRRGEDVILRKLDAHIFGGFQYASCSENGALYLDKGELVFCYSQGGVPHIVLEGVDNEYDSLSGEALDAKYFNGSLYCMLKRDNQGIWSSGQTWVGEGVCADCGDVYYENAWRTAAYDFNNALMLDFGGNGGILYASNMGVSCVRYNGKSVSSCYMPLRNGPGNLRAEELGIVLRPEGEYRFISENCAVLNGDRLLMALSSDKAGEGPSIYEGNSVRKLKINGFVSSISLGE